MAKNQTRHEKGRAGARVSYRNILKDGKPRVEATVTRAGMPRWRRLAETKGKAQELVSQYLGKLEIEGFDAEALNGAARLDAARAKKMLHGGSLAEAVRELLDCRRLLELTDAEDKPVGGDAADLAGKVKVAVAEYALARAGLGGRATMREAVAFWAARNPNGEGVTLGEARAAFLKWEREEKEVERSSLNRLEARLVAFSEWLGGGGARQAGDALKAGDARAVASVEAREMESFLDWHGRGSDSFTNATRRKWRVTFRHFFGWAAAEYRLPFDPSAQLPKPPKKTKGKGEKKEIEFLQAEKVEKLLRAAERVAPAYVPAVAILFFAGVRPWELSGKYEGKGKAVPGLDWGKVDRDGEIVIDGDIAKTRQRRTIPMEANLKAWVDSYAPEVREGPVARNPIGWRRAREAIVKEAGVEWPQDAARHTYATMHFAKYGDRARLESALGHTMQSGVLEEHYKGLALRTEAAKFWKIYPSK